MKNTKGIGVLSAVIGMILYKVMSNYYGTSGPKLLVYVCVSLSLGAVISLLVMKEFTAAIFVSMLVLPLVVGAIGIYLDSLITVVGSIILLFVMLAIIFKLLPYATNYKKKK